MDYHKNAPWTAVSRERLARMVIEDGVRLGSAAAPLQRQRENSGEMGGAVSAVWGRRPGRSQLASAPQPAADHFLLVEKVLALRRGHMPGYEVARRTGLSPATVSRILRRAKLSRWCDLNPPPPIKRYEHPRPGDLLHLDIKGMTRFAEVTPRGDGRLRGKQNIPASWPCTCRRRSLADGLYADAPRSESRNHHRLFRSAVDSSLPTASAYAPCSPTTAPATAPQFRHACQQMAIKHAAPDLTRREPMARPNALSRPPCGNGPTQNTGTTQNKEMLTCSLGSTITTASDPMVASTTSRPSAAPKSEQRLDHLQAPTRVFLG